MTTAADFDYIAPRSLEAALAVMAEAGDGATVLAGGQSLVPMLDQRRVAPTRVVDLGRIDDLATITEEGQHLVLGAMATHHTVSNSELVARHALLLGRACADIGDPQIRHRGTVGGALAQADPAGDVGAVALALDAQLVIAGAAGVTRTVAAAEFFLDRGRSVLRPGELLTKIRIPQNTGWGAHYEKFVRVAHQWAIVGVAATVRIDGGQIAAARIGLANLGRTPLRATSVERSLIGLAPTEQAVTAAAATVVDGTDPPSDVHADADYRRQLAPVLTARAVLAAVTMALTDHPWTRVESSGLT